MNALLKYMAKTGKKIKDAKIGEKALEGTAKGLGYGKGVAQFAGKKGKAVVDKHPKLSAAAAGAAGGIALGRASKDDEKKKKKRPYLDDGDE